MNKEPLFGCCQCYEDYSYPARDLVVVDGELWCDNCFMESDMAWEKNLTTADFPTYVPEYEKTINALRTENEELRDKVDDYKDYFDRAYKSMPTDEIHCTCVPMLLKRAELADAEVNKMAKRWRDADDKLKVAVEALEEIANSRFCSYEETPPGVYGVGVADGHRYCANISKESLAKIGGDDER